MKTIPDQHKLGLCAKFAHRTPPWVGEGIDYYIVRSFDRVARIVGLKQRRKSKKKKL